MLTRLGLPLSEKQIPQVVVILESGSGCKEALETTALLRRQVLYPPELRAHSIVSKRVIRCFGFLFQTLCTNYAQLHSTNSPFHGIGGRMDVSLTDHDTRMPHELHDSKGVCPDSAPFRTLRTSSSP